MTLRSRAGTVSGCAIQAYQKRAEAVIDYIDQLAQALGRRLMVRLVKGAYWDTEIKRAQERGLDDYPVFTRKAMTDLNYLACARKLLALRPRLFPQFATHNALTVATVLELAGDASGFEFQRLHGMGEALYAQLSEDFPGLAYRTYAPVGSHRDLLAYLVRRLLENGANSSFVALAADDAVPVATLLRRPADIIGSRRQCAAPEDPPAARSLSAAAAEFARHRIRRARGIDRIARCYRGGNRACRGGAADQRRDKNGDGAAGRQPDRPDNLGGKRRRSDAGAGRRGHRRRARGIFVLEPNAGRDAARKSWSEPRICWNNGARISSRCCNARAARRSTMRFPKSARPSISAATTPPKAANCFAGETMPGPTGESNELQLRGRGVFVAISPWNFPLAIFAGQVTAALMAGNAVVAKPAEQTPLVAAEAVRLLHEAGVPASALHLLPGDGGIGAALAAHPDIAGVVFTGSTEVARAINRALAAKDGPIVPLIAETGGINAMIVDATALPEQVADDVVTSAFRSAGQRCSALRLLFVQDDVAGRMIEMISGAARELAIGDPRDIATQIGPVIDAEAKHRLEAHIARMKNEARVHFAGVAPPGNYVAPHIFELADAGQLTEEVFGPVLHLVRYPADRLDRVLQSIERSGYGLTLGIHSRIDDTIEAVIDRLSVGNVYVNRNMIGAVVGVQPFGGQGLSGTGPKAGGPHYLARFATEQTVTVNTSAAGGNAALLSDLD